MRTGSEQVTRSRSLDPDRGPASRRKSQPWTDSLRGEPDPRPEGPAARQVAVELAGDVAREKADDVSLGTYRFDLALVVGRGGGVMRDAHYGDEPERAIGLAVPSAVEAMSVAIARRDQDGSDPIQVGPSASECRRSGLSPALTKRAAAVSGPTPKRPRRSDAAAHHSR